MTLQSLKIIGSVSLALLLAQPSLAQCTLPTSCNVEGQAAPGPKAEILQIDSSGNQTICVNACATNRKCKSFSYETNAVNNEGPTTYCHLYNRPVESLNFTPDEDTGTVYWNKNCYGPPKCPTGQTPDIFVLRTKSSNATVRGLYVQVAYNFYTASQGNNLISHRRAATLFTIESSTGRLLDFSEPTRIAENFCPKKQENVFFSRPGARDGIESGDCKTDRFQALTCSIDATNTVSCDSSTKRRDRSFSYGCVNGPQEYSPNGWLLGGPELLRRERRFCSPISLVAFTSSA